MTAQKRNFVLQKPSDRIFSQKKRTELTYFCILEISKKCSFVTSHLRLAWELLTRIPRFLYCHGSWKKPKKNNNSKIDAKAQFAHNVLKPHVSVIQPYLNCCSTVLPCSRGWGSIHNVLTIDYPPRLRLFVSNNMFCSFFSPWWCHQKAYRIWAPFYAKVTVRYWDLSTNRSRTDS